VIFEKWPQRWDWRGIIAYFGMTAWLNQYVVGKIAFELGATWLYFDDIELAL